MSKYIDKDELWERLRKRMVHHIVTNTLFNTIKAVIDGMPTIEVSEDCISREWVKGICKIMLDEEMLGHMLGYIEDAPSVVPSCQKNRQVGEWVDRDGNPCNHQFSLYCSNCKAWSEYRGRFCPNCGCKMEGE